MELYGEVERSDGGTGLQGQKCFEWSAKVERTKTSVEMLSSVYNNLGIKPSAQSKRFIFGGLEIK